MRVVSKVTKLGRSSLSVTHSLYKTETKEKCAEFKSVSVPLDPERRGSIPLIDVIGRRSGLEA